MTPLTLGSASRNVPEDFPQLLELLAGRPQPAVVCYRPNAADGAAVSGADDGPEGGPDSAEPDSTEPERVELSGRVLQNWAVKLIGLFTEELEEIFDPAEPAPRVLVGSTPHWKSAAVVLAASSLGAQVVTAADEIDSSGAASLVVTDRPQDWQSSPALGEAELAALSPGLLDESFEDAVGQEIPAWVLDISAEVRQHPDQLLTPLEPVRLPESIGSGGTALVTRAEWSADAVGTLLSTWAHGDTVVLIDGAPEDPAWGRGRWEKALRNEGLA